METRLYRYRMQVTYTILNVPGSSYILKVQKVTNFYNILFIYLDLFILRLVPLYSPSWPRTCGDPSAFKVLGLQARTSTQSYFIQFKQKSFQRKHFNTYSSFLKINVILLFSKQAFKIWYSLQFTPNSKSKSDEAHCSARSRGVSAKTLSRRALLWTFELGQHRRMVSTFKIKNIPSIKMALFYHCSMSLLEGYAK